MRGPEQNLERNIDRSFESKRIDKLYEAAERFFRDNALINPDSPEFRERYGDETVEIDIERVTVLEKRFAEQESPEEAENRKLAKVLEAVLAEQIELSDWMGPNTETIIPSKYDDYVNGVDVIAEVNKPDDENPSHLALAVDITFGRNVSAKMERILSDIRGGHLASVKYFHGESAPKGMPRVIIGADRAVVKELGERWLARDIDALARHEMQAVLLEEITTQLNAFAQYATQQNQPEVANAYHEALETLQGAIGDKERIPLETLANDGVLRAIRRETARVEHGSLAA